LLAAGRSERFGAEDKLLAPFRGFPLYLHAANALLALPFAAHLIVCASEEIETPAGFKRVEVAPGLPQSATLKAGIEALPADGIDAVLIALADMPCVPAVHFEALLAAFVTALGVPVASCGMAQKPMPPAVFARNRWADLMALQGDQGARALLGDAVLVCADEGALIDVDCVEDLKTATASCAL
jgi:molybdenum cofactor cytidylyltransferase